MIVARSSAFLTLLRLFLYNCVVSHNAIVSLQQYCIKYYMLYLNLVYL